MTGEPDPNYCAFCGDGLYNRGPSGNPQRIGEIFETLSNGAVTQMQGSNQQKREARQAFAVKIGVCPECLNDNDLAPGDLDNLSNKYDQISLTYTELVSERDLSK
ncbi:hypothetical protein [Halorarius halobius]|uniref:hypothetical protein n=1 Tax=Halorarius halobius TaxID=2962671 RepID=UPI0020CF9D71|nr:hypothetical protein [Halorarius halobius]